MRTLWHLKLQAVAEENAIGNELENTKQTNKQKILIASKQKIVLCWFTLLLVCLQKNVQKAFKK